MQGKIIIMGLVTAMLLISGCGKNDGLNRGESSETSNVMDNSTNDMTSVSGLTGTGYVTTQVVADTDIEKLEKGLSVVRFDGNDLFEDFLENHGAASDADVVSFLSGFMLGLSDAEFTNEAFGCSTIAVKSENGYLYGRNFDWNKCDALIVESHPTDAYASISTVNMDFIKSGAGPLIKILPDDKLSLVALYAPLDGMNEKGLFISVNMIQDSAVIDQNTDKDDITTTTAVRLLLNKASNVDEAVKLLESYDMHASFGMMIHFMIADTEGNSVVCEYIDNELVVTKTPVVTNFYLTEGEKYGIGTEQSHDRYEKLMEIYDAKTLFDESDVAGALNSVSKHNYGSGESTEWSIVFNSDTCEALYFHREDYDEAYCVKLE